MNRIDVAGLTEADLKAIATNARQVFMEQLGMHLPALQLRNCVAQLFGAASWQSLLATASHCPRSEPDNRRWVGVRNVQGSGYGPDSGSTQRFYGATEDSVYEQIGRGVCLSAFRELLRARRLDDGEIEDALVSINISPDRVAALSRRLADLPPAERYGADYLFTGREIVTAYLEIWGDEESIVVSRTER